MSAPNPKVDRFLKNAKTWRPEMEKLREIAFASGLTEDLKWSKPCYSFEGRNLVGIAPLKDHCWYNFFKGVLLRDPERILVPPGENSQSARVIKFTSLEQIIAMEPILTAYLLEVIEVERAGLQVDFKQSKNLIFPAELIEVFDNDPNVRAAFDALTPGRQRAYNLHFSGAKQSQTRTARIEKCIPDILAGKGLNER